MVFSFKVFHFALLLLDFALNVRDEQARLLQLLVQIPDISLDRVTDFGQSGDLVSDLLKLRSFFLVNILVFDLSGTTIFLA